MVRESVSEINIRRLLTRCETIASDAQHTSQKIDWKLPKYLNHLSNEIEALKSSKDVNVSEDIILEYKRKVDFLQDVVKQDEIKNPLDRSYLCQQSSTVTHDESFKHSTVKELHQQVKGKHQRDLKEQLLEKDTNRLRHRNVGSHNDSTKNDIDDIIKHHNDMQEKVAEEMISMAKSMKENSLIASDILQRDNIELDSTTKVVSSNYVKLKTESERLDEINQKRCSYTIWIMLALVCIVFINMIIFIKLFPKR